METLEARIAEWRSFVEHGSTVDGRDVEELENHLRDQIVDLESAGLSDQEAFLIAVKRLGSLDELSREFANEDSGRLWRQLVSTKDVDEQEFVRTSWEPLIFGIAAAVTILVVLSTNGYPNEMPAWLVRSASLIVLSFLAAYFGRRRRLSARQWAIGALPIAIVAVVVNVYPYEGGGSTELLVAAHLPVVMWFVVAYPYMGGAIGSHERRMDYVRFTGEWFIYYVLIALGGGVLLGLTALILEPIGANSERIVEWVLPAGATGAVVIAAWLVESKQRVIENMAPVLTTIFTPLFALMVALAAGAYIVWGIGADFDRELLGTFDALLVVVLGLVLYGTSARDAAAPPGWTDRIQLVTIVGALVLDMIVLAAMVGRIGELGFTPNRTMALGLNLVLAVDLLGAAWLSWRFLSGRGAHHRLVRWQTGYLPVFAVWAFLMVIVLPPVFAFG